MQDKTGTKSSRTSTGFPNTVQILSRQPGDAFYAVFRQTRVKILSPSLRRHYKTLDEANLQNEHWLGGSSTGHALAGRSAYYSSAGINGGQ
jgi:hypothetical protein